LKIYLYKWR